MGKNMGRWKEEAHGEKGAEVSDKTSEQAVLTPSHSWYRQTGRHMTHTETRSLCRSARQGLIRAKCGGGWGEHMSRHRGRVPSLNSDSQAHSVPTVHPQRLSPPGLDAGPSTGRETAEVG